ncbi:hypothetical protein UlMin_036866 [Ulmus minor]
MGGIGKTTLAQLVYNDQRVKNHFQIRVWVTISTQFDVFYVTKQIFKEVTSREFGSKELSLLQGELSMALKGMKFLFVLDDVWTEEYLLWDELRGPFKFGASGSKILITTRSSNVASTTSRVQARTLRGLSYEFCWMLFIHHAFENEDLLNAYPEQREIGEEIVRKCRGLPLAVKSVAALLRSIPLDEWRMILESQIWDLKLQEHASKYVLPALWLSYRHLSPQLRRCFAYCSIFPKDYRFYKEEVILLWIGEGLLEARGGTRMEDVGEEYFKTLLSWSFFQLSYHDQISNESNFIMHDCVHDLAKFVLGDFGFRLDGNNLLNLPSKTRHFSFMREQIHGLEQFEHISDAKCLHTFLPLPLGYSGTFSDECLVPLQKLLREEGCLRVLSLYDCGIAKLPDSIGNLKHLRYLDLSYTSIKVIPDTICTLYNLETLLLISCIYLTRLPTHIGRLIKLRLVDFRGSSIQELPQDICNMKDLQSLPRFILGKEHADSSIKELGAFQQLHGELSIQGLENVVDAKNVSEAKMGEKKFLTNLRLNWDGDSDDSVKQREILDRLQPHTNLKELIIDGYKGTRLSDWMGDQSFSNIVRVILSRCENCRSLSPLEQLPSLKALYIQESFTRVETISWEFFSNGSSMTKAFSSLEYLCFEGMAEWKEWFFSESKAVFPRLEELLLCECPKLEVRLLPDCFPSLTTLRVLECRQLMPLLIPSLQELVIGDCPEQEFILEGGLPSTLKKISISRCNNLKALDEQSFQLLTSLQWLEIQDCKELQRLPELPTYTFDLWINSCPILESRCQKENGEDWPKIKHTRLVLR